MFQLCNQTCGNENLCFWRECSLFCSSFDIYDHVETNTFYYCKCEPFLCQKYYSNPKHERLPQCYNCKISGDCRGLSGH